ncbi:GNAT family N-acetyltransferase [Actinacidiphila sp. bgisy160]|uniref:GNAT family N-acetyltransferase n=1 Tax=Actinacidiphila sp. bgisy160 TaxID=3413796 RepID=UPI003D713854
MISSAAVDALDGAMERLTDFLPGAFTRQGPKGGRLVCTGLPVALLNTVRTGPGQDPRETGSLAEELSATGLPWSMQVRGEADPELTTLAARFGLTSTTRLPLLAWDAASLPGLPAALPADGTVRKLSGEDSGRYSAALAAGFGMPGEIADAFALPALLDAPGMTAFTLDVAGEAVATGFNVLVGGHVGMFNGSVPPRHRGNGYYRALVTARLRDAVASGARHAVTQNSPMSRPLYESLGFRLVETWTYLTPAG